MFVLNDSQQKAVGLYFILKELSPDSPFGAEKINKIQFYTQSEKSMLEQSFYNIERLISFMKNNPVDSVRRLLMRFKNIRNILKKCEVSFLHEIELFEMKSFMLTFMKFYAEFSAINAICEFDGIRFKDMEEALNVLDPDKKRAAPFSISEKYTKELWEIRQEKSRVENLLHFEKQPAVIEELKIKRAHIVAQEEAEETEIKKRLSKELQPFLPLFFENIDNLGMFDFTMQKALLAVKYGAVRPEISDGGALRLENMINPEIEFILKQNGKSFTPVTIELAHGVTIITGANMGGKSVAVKTAILNVCMCQMGFYVFCSGAKIPLFDDVFLISEDLQSVSKGLSTFGAEIVHFNEIVEQSKNKFVFIALDEFARGTNPEEGAIIVKAVVKYLNEKKCISVVTTHYDNIVSDEFHHYQVAGLKNINLDDLSAYTKSGVDFISEYMDYRLLKSDGRKETPKDALNICRILALDADVLAKIEKSYKK